MPFSTLALLLCAAATPEEGTSARLLRPEVAASTGIYATAYTATGLTYGDAMWAAAAQARGLIGGLTGDLSVLGLFPLASNQAVGSVDLVPRVGWTGYRWSVLAGAAVQIAPVAHPVAQVLPSLRAQVDFGRFGLSAGVFDIYGQVPFHLSAEVGDFSLGYAAPLGFVASARFKLPKGLRLRVQTFVYRLFEADAGMLTLGLGWEGA
jgi:hypothetical protein